MTELTRMFNEQWSGYFNESSREYKDFKIWNLYHKIEFNRCFVWSTPKIEESLTFYFYHQVTCLESAVNALLNGPESADSINTLTDEVKALRAKIDGFLSTLRILRYISTTEKDYLYKRYVSGTIARYPSRDDLKEYQKEIIDYLR